MTAEENSSSGAKRPIVINPWLVVIAALIGYAITVDHWVTLTSLPLMAKVTGWDWHALPMVWRPGQVFPLYLVLTSPIRVLPGSIQPLALNVFSAICAALILGLLAASVRLLPHDRTKEQRQRENGAFALLSSRAAFLPVLFAVIVMGLQLTFWRDTMSANVDILNLLVFAFLIFCLLKFRVSQSDTWLLVFAFAYGLGVTNDWALIGFFPLFLVAMVWIKGVNFFNWRFLLRLAGCGVLGLLLYLVMPALGALSAERANFFTLLHLELGAQSFGLRQVPRWVAVVAALPTLLPLIFAGISWPSFEGEISAAGNTLTKFMFRILHMFFLLLALVMFFDFKFSPGLHLKEQPAGFLTFYYIGAICIGYFSGYILLVYGRSLTQSWERRGPLAKAFNLFIVGLLWLLAVAAPCGLIYQNLPHISAHKNHALSDFSDEVLRDLSAKPGIILADDPAQLYLLEAAFRRAGKPSDALLLDTSSMQHREYISYLEGRYPDLRKLTVPATNLPPVLPPDALIRYLLGLHQKYPIYYLSPSFGYYFEAFYLIPHGLVYELQPYKTENAQPAPSEREIQENQAIWDRLGKTSVSTISSEARLDPATAMLSGIISVGLNYWAVVLQKNNHLKEASARFAEAIRINSQNFIAKINKDYNEHLQKNDPRPLDTGDTIFKAVNLYQGVVPILKYNGPVDEPGLDIDFGSMMADAHLYRQAVMLFERRLQLLPGDIISQLDLAKTYVDWGLPDKALTLVQRLRNNVAAPKWEVARVEALAYYAKGDYLTAEKLMVAALKENPTDENRVRILSEFFRASGYNALRDAGIAMNKTNLLGRDKALAESNRRFTNALAYYDQDLRLLTASTHDQGNHALPEVLLKKAEVQMMLKQFEPAISTLNQITAIQPGNPTALLNRAIAEVQVNQLQAAKDDFKALRKLLPHQSYVIELGLADIAVREKDKTEEIRRLKRYLESAPEDSPEYKRVKQRLQKAESP